VGKMDGFSMLACAWALKARAAMITLRDRAIFVVFCSQNFQSLKQTTSMERSSYQPTCPCPTCLAWPHLRRVRDDA
jgi:hypothetical protein